MPLLALVGVVSAAAWLLVPVSGLWLTGMTAFALLAVAVAVFALGECLHGAVQPPLVVDLADPRLLGRYMAISALSWQVGFTVGPGRRRRPARRLSDRALARDGVRAAAPGGCHARARARAARGTAAACRSASVHRSRWPSRSRRASRSRARAAG